MISKKTEQARKQWTRVEQVENLVDFDERKISTSQREWCGSNDVPRSTLQHWLERRKTIDAHPELIRFFESDMGLAFLHRLTATVHFAFTKVGNAGVRDVVRFLELSGLSAFVASSVGAQHNISKAMDAEIGAYAKSEAERLSASMPAKKVMLAEDETFHPDICLVAMDLVSNYILVEKYVEKRDGETWREAVAAGLDGLPVEVVEVVGDQGKAIVGHAEKGLGVHHSPDLFHVSYEIGKGTSGALSSEIKKAEKEHLNAGRRTRKETAKREEHRSLETKPVGRPPDFDKRVMKAEEEEREAADALKRARENLETVRENKLTIGRVYHPYDLETGREQSAEPVEALLDGCFEKIDEATESLSERCRKHVEKARRVVKKMKATIAFFFSMIGMIVENMEVSSEIKRIVYDRLVPGFYLLEAARKEKNAELAERILEKAQELLSVLHDRCGVLARCSEEELESIERTSKECARFFQRSSSPVEGRNAQLSLHHHNMHRLSNLKLSALTAIHNFYIERSDGTTAAERFFESKPKDMFEHLLDRIDLPARPRRKRLKLAV